MSQDFLKVSILSTFFSLFFLITPSSAQNFGDEFVLTQTNLKTNLSADYLQKNKPISIGFESALDIEQQGIPVRKAQAIFFELFGAGLTYSFNYDTRFQQSRDGLGGRIGISYISIDDASNSFLTIPAQLNYLLGNNNKYFEMGIGATYISSATDFLIDGDNGVLGTMTFGYRLQPEDSGFLFRATVSPIFANGTFIPYWFGVSFGYAF